MERLIQQNVYHDRHLDYRGMPAIESMSKALRRNMMLPPCLPGPSSAKKKKEEEGKNEEVSKEETEEKEVEKTITEEETKDEPQKEETCVSKLKLFGNSNVKRRLHVR